MKLGAKKLLALVLALVVAGACVAALTACNSEPPIDPDRGAFSLSYNKGAYMAEGTLPETQYYDEGEEVTVAACQLTFEGHTFAGWSDGENVYAEGATFTMPAHDLRLTAVWEDGSPDEPKLTPLSVGFDEGYFVFSGDAANIDTLYVYLNNTNVGDSLDNYVKADVASGAFSARLSLATLIGYGKVDTPFNLRYKVDSFDAAVQGVTKGELDLSATCTYGGYDFRLQVNSGTNCVAVYYSAHVDPTVSVAVTSVNFDGARGECVVGGSAENVEALYVYLNNTSTGLADGAADNHVAAAVADGAFTARLPLDTLVGFGAPNTPFNLRYKIGSTDAPVQGVAQGALDISATCTYLGYDFTLKVNSGTNCVAVYYSAHVDPTVSVAVNSIAFDTEHGEFVVSGTTANVTKLRIYLVNTNIKPSEDNYVEIELTDGAFTARLSLDTLIGYDVASNVPFNLRYRANDDRLNTNVPRGSLDLAQTCTYGGKDFKLKMNGSCVAVYYEPHVDKPDPTASVTVSSVAFDGERGEFVARGVTENVDTLYVYLNNTAIGSDDAASNHVTAGITEGLFEARLPLDTLIGYGKVNTPFNLRYKVNSLDAPMQGVGQGELDISATCTYGGYDFRLQVNSGTKCVAVYYSAVQPEEPTVPEGSEAITLADRDTIMADAGNWHYMVSNEETAVEYSTKPWFKDDSLGVTFKTYQYKGPIIDNKFSFRMQPAFGEGATYTVSFTITATEDLDLRVGQAGVKADGSADYGGSNYIYPHVAKGERTTVIFNGTISTTEPFSIGINRISSGAENLDGLEILIEGITLVKTSPDPVPAAAVDRVYFDGGDLVVTGSAEYVDSLYFCLASRDVDGSENPVAATVQDGAFTVRLSLATLLGYNAAGVTFRLGYKLNDLEAEIIPVAVGELALPEGCEFNDYMFAVIDDGGYIAVSYEKILHPSVTAESLSFDKESGEFVVTGAVQDIEVLYVYLNNANVGGSTNNYVTAAIEGGGFTARLSLATLIGFGKVGTPFNLRYKIGSTDAATADVGEGALDLSATCLYKGYNFRLQVNSGAKCVAVYYDSAVTVSSVAFDGEQGEFIVTGTAPEVETLYVYLNNTEVIASVDNCVAVKPTEGAFEARLPLDTLLGYNSGKPFNLRYRIDSTAAAMINVGTGELDLSATCVYNGYSFTIAVNTGAKCVAVSYEAVPSAVTVTSVEFEAGALVVKGSAVNVGALYFYLGNKDVADSAENYVEATIDGGEFTARLSLATLLGYNAAGIAFRLGYKLNDLEAEIILVAVGELALPEECEFNDYTFTVIDDGGYIAMSYEKILHPSVTVESLSFDKESGEFVVTGAVQDIEVLYVYLNNANVDAAKDYHVTATIEDGRFTARIPLDTLIGFGKVNTPFNLRYKIGSTEAEMQKVEQGALDLSAKCTYGGYDFELKVNSGSGCVAVYYSAHVDTTVSVSVTSISFDEAAGEFVVTGTAKNVTKLRIYLVNTTIKASENNYVEAELTDGAFTARLSLDTLIGYNVGSKIPFNLRYRANDATANTNVPQGDLDIGQTCTYGGKDFRLGTNSGCVAVYYSAHVEPEPDYSLSVSSMLMTNGKFVIEGTCGFSVKKLIFHLHNDGIAKIDRTFEATIQGGTFSAEISLETIGAEPSETALNVRYEMNDDGFKALNLFPETDGSFVVGQQYRYDDKQWTLASDSAGTYLEWKTFADINKITRVSLSVIDGKPVLEIEGTTASYYAANELKLQLAQSTNGKKDKMTVANSATEKGTFRFIVDLSTLAASTRTDDPTKQEAYFLKITNPDETLDINSRWASDLLWERGEIEVNGEKYFLMKNHKWAEEAWNALGICKFAAE